jgi:ascorbate-specific PTS system EIIC-type component UlaA
VNLSGVWDWDFFWNCFGFLLKTVASFVMIVIAIIAVGMLINAVIKAVRSSRD